MNLTSITVEQLKRAVQIKEQIENLQSQLSVLVGKPQIGKSQSTATQPAKPGGKRKGMSPAGRARIAAAQRARWAKVKGKAAPQKTAAAPKKRTMSPAAKAKIAAAAKARWAKAKAAGKNSL
jgi:hypothetical protein